MTRFSLWGWTPFTSTSSESMGQRNGLILIQHHENVIERMLAVRARHRLIGFMP
ncbi:MAG: hypothetical protein ACR2NP_12330 [Pirellulaceae bacterium]